MSSIDVVGPTSAWYALLGALLIGACVTDVRARRIPNALVVAVLVAGLARAALAAGWGPALLLDPTAPLPLQALLAVVIGLAIGLPLYALGIMGAGDVKLFAAAAAWLGPAGLSRACWWTAIAGGVLAIGWVVTTPLRRAPVPVAGRRGMAARAGALPYGLAVAAGVFAGVLMVPR
ncbi:MAG: A24 family peptidase [Gemmatirosa sp.]